MTVPHATPAGAGLRLLRAAVFTAVCVVLSAAGHALASCATVPWWALVIAFLAVFAVAAPLAGRRRSLPGIAAALAFGQLGLHTVFGLGQHSAASAQAPAGADTSLAALAARLVCGGNSVPLSPADARQILETAGLDPAAQAAAQGAAPGAAAACSAPACSSGTCWPPWPPAGSWGAATPPCSGSWSCPAAPPKSIPYVRCAPRWPSYGPSAPGSRVPRPVPRGRPVPLPNPPRTRAGTHSSTR